MTSGTLIEPQDIVSDPVIVFPRNIAFDKFHESIALFGVCLLQHIIQHFQLHKVHLSLVSNRKIWVQIELVVVISDEIETKAVDRRNLSLVNQRELTDQMFIFRIFLHLLFYGSADPLLHFIGRSVGIGHHQQTVHIHRFLF